VLFRLARGSGIAGLSGMARMVALGDLALVRPLLALPKVRLLATLKAAGVAFADDPSNRDPRFTRARLRHVLPVLAGEGLDAARFATFARRAGRANRAIEVVTAVAAERLIAAPGSAPGRIVIDAEGFAGGARQARITARRHYAKPAARRSGAAPHSCRCPGDGREGPFLGRMRPAKGRNGSQSWRFNHTPSWQAGPRESPVD
jgi:tRNA(Ile)-lysidine synthase TilS/MesJ